jgi:Spy/CpxP family protein refolding chaperone
MTTRRLLHCGLAAAGVLAISALAFAQSFNAKPGLWETTSQNTMGGMPQMPEMPKVDTSKMTPEQAAAVQAAMARARGGAAPPTTSRKCWTQEQIDKEQFHDKALNDSCTQTVVSRSARVLELKFDCTGENASTGTLKLTSIDSEHVNGAVTMTMTGGRGAGMTMNSTFTSKWIGANCGDVK